jgi:hypothetical protein
VDRPVQHSPASSSSASAGSATSTAGSASTTSAFVLFAAFLGYNPVQHLVGPQALAALPAHAHSVLTGSTFFPRLISGPFRDGLDIAFVFAIVTCLVAAAASLMRGGRYHHAEEPAAEPGIPGQIPQLEKQHSR